MEEKNENYWERLSAVIRWSNMTTNHFAHFIGLKNGENLYQIKRGNNKISRRLAESIVKLFPEISIAWLMSGDGDMFTPKSQRGVDLKFFDIDIESNIRDVAHTAASSTMRLPAVVDADFSVMYRGNEMSPTIPANTIVALKRIEPMQIIPGKEYLIVSSSIVALRVVRNAESSDSKLRLVAANRDMYDDIEIERGSIEDVYKVAAKLIINY